VIETGRMSEAGGPPAGFSTSAKGKIPAGILVVRWQFGGANPVALA
jgi:hypothetical protein